MNTNLTEIAFILDRSGSMQSCLEAAIAGFNQFLREQQSAPGQARFTLVLFDDQYEVPCLSIPITEVTALDTTTFVPRGSTALLDAIGRTIDELGAKLDAEPETNRPGQVLVAILTDGLENASHRYSLQDVSSRIARQRDTYQWRFLFLGAGQDAIATAVSMNIAAHDSSAFIADNLGFRTSGSSMSRKTMALRKSQAKAPMTAKEQADLHASMSEITAEEDKKARDEGKPGDQHGA